MARLRINLRKCLLILPFLGLVGLWTLRAPTQLEIVRQVRGELAARNIIKSCKVLDCEDGQGCEQRKEEGRHKWNNVENSLVDGSCDAVRQELQLEGVAAEEQQVPLAFSILAHRDFQQFLRLFQAVYRPHNLYCIQIDAKSSPSYLERVSRLIGCLNQEGNIFMSSRNISLIWQHSSLLEGDLGCLEQLLEKEHPWKFYVNIVGSEYPLTTNHVLARKLSKIGNGIGFVDARFPHAEILDRWKFSHVLPQKKETQAISIFGGYYKLVPQRTDILKTPPPRNITIMSGLKNVAITRKFADFVINSEIGKELRSWLQDVQVAVEHFYPTLAVIFTNSEELDLKPSSRVIYDRMQELNEFKMRQTFWWQDGASCYGQWKRDICVLTLQDLPNILQTTGFMMNKFDSDLDFAVVDCISDILYKW